MTPDPHDVVRVAAGEMVQIELYQQALKEAGVESNVLGDALESSFGTAIPGSIELWVHRSDAERAAVAIERLEAERGIQRAEKQTHDRPSDTSERPRQGGHGPHTHYNADPRS